MDAPVSAQGADKYRNFAQLAASEVEARDYRITTIERPSPVAIIAPHGGSIERRTSAIARAIAAEDFNLYLFEGLDASGSFDVLHITSHRFDEPRCLHMIARCDTVVAVHGCAGDQARVMLGGRDSELIARFGTALGKLPVPVLTADHAFPGTHRRNVCNRGRRGRGVQIELSDGLRGGAHEARIVAALRQVLLSRHARRRTGRPARHPRYCTGT